MSFSFVKKTYTKYEQFYFVHSRLGSASYKMNDLYSLNVSTPFLKDKEDSAILGIAENVITVCMFTPFMEDIRGFLNRGYYTDSIELQAVIVEMHNNLQLHMNKLVTSGADAFPLPLDDAIVNTFLDTLSIIKVYYIPVILGVFYANSKEKAYQEFLKAEEVKKNKHLTGE